MVDSVAGAVVSAAAVLLVAWMVASPLASSPFPQVASQVRQSALVQAVDRAVPDGVRVGLRLPARGDRPARAARRPRPAHPDPGPRRARARPGAADQPGRRRGAGLGGQGQRHRAVLLPADRRLRLRLRPGAGDDQRARARRGQPTPSVHAEGEEYDATPVYVDEEVDIAVLAVPGLPEVPLPFTPDAGRHRRRRDHHGLPRRRAVLRRRGPRARPRARSAGRTSATPRPSSATSTRCSAPSAPATPAARCSPPTAACSASSSPRPSTTRTPATRSPRPQVADAARGRAAPRDGRGRAPAPASRGPFRRRRLGGP